MINNTFKKLFMLLAVCLISFSAFSQNIPNPDFETWSPMGFPSYQNPTGWGNLNGSTAGVLTCEQGTGADAHSGSYAIKLTSRLVFIQNAPGITVTGTISTNQNDPNPLKGGFIYTQRPDYLKGWYKYAPASGDFCTIEVLMWKWNTTTLQRDIIVDASFTQSNAISSFTQFMVPLTYLNANTPDSARIYMISTNSSNIQLGSSLIVDDLEFVFCNGLAVSVGKTDVSTNGGSDGTATANVTGGTASYTYSWSPTGGTSSSISGLNANTYCVTVTDANSCTASACAVVSSPSCTNFSVSVTTTDATTVGGNEGSATAVPANGAMPYTYLWNNTETTAAINGLIAGIYSVTVTDSLGCLAIASDTVNQPSCIGFSASATAVDASGAAIADGSATANETGGTSPYTYEWNNSDTSKTITVAPGTYTVTVADAVGCTTTASATVSFTVGIHNAVNEIIKVYPNPANNLLNIELNSSAFYTFSMFDVSGKMVLNKMLSEKKNLISLSNTVSGIYVYSVKNNVDGKTLYGKLSIQ